MSDKLNPGAAQEAIDLSGWARTLTQAARPVSHHAGGTSLNETGRVAASPEASKSYIRPDHNQEALAHRHAANDSLLTQAGRIIVDESQPFYLATLPGILQNVNDAYRSLAAEAGDTLPSSGTPVIGAMVPLEHRKILKQVADTGDTVTTEEWVGAQSQQRCWRGRHFPVRNQAGDLIAVAGTYTEITLDLSMRHDAIYARRRFSDFARAASDWFWETDRQGRLTLLSERFAASAGLPAAVFYKRPLTDLGKSGADTSLVKRLEQALADRTPFRNVPIEIKSADTETKRCHLSGVPVFDSTDGTFLGFRGAGMDVTQMHRNAVRAAEMRQNLQSTLEELTRKNLELDIASVHAESALRAKNEFLAAMSHELRTPLNAIIGFAESMDLQTFGELNDQYRSYSRDISGAGRHLLSLINDVLDVAVLESNGMSVEPEPLSLKTQFEQAAGLIRIRAQGRNIDLSALTLPRDVTIFADDRRTTQIFLNLLTNATKFTHEGGRIGAELRTGDGMAAVTIWDTGIGIPPNMQERVFDKFQQVRETIYSRSSEGAGLGLHISRELARLMGGDIQLVSKEGSGSRFTVTLPMLKDHASSTTAGTPQDASATPIE